MHYIEPIGELTTILINPEDCPMQGAQGGVEAVLEIFPPFIEGIKDISVGSDLVILTWLHLADRDVITCYPGNKTAKAKVGVFLTRSPDRPNPIGLHQVTVLQIIGDNRIKIFPIEVITGTPVLDIKPVI